MFRHNKPFTSARNLACNLALLAAFIGHTATAFAQSSGTFTATGSMTTPRAGHTATLLSDGRVLIAGGNFTAPPSAELYDPATGTFTATGNMINGGLPVLQPDGTVLFISVAGVERFDPSTGTFTAIASGKMIDAQGGGTATLLSNGKILITGATSGSTSCCFIPARPEIFDPSTGAFTLTGDYSDTGAGSPYGGKGITDVPATLLFDGRVLISAEPTAELFDPVTATFSSTGEMTTRWDGLKPPYLYGRTAVLLANGKVLVAGGEQEDLGTFANAELYDPGTGLFTATGHMTRVRDLHAATRLQDGTVLVTGGESLTCDANGCWYSGPEASAELYDPVTGTFTGVGNMTAQREFHTSTVLKDGRVLITGGGYATAELYYTGCSVNSNGAACPSGPWQNAIVRMKASAGTDSLNFWQWAWYWQTLPAFSGAPAGLGVGFGSISPDLMSQITTAGGGDPLSNVSAEQWVLYFRQVLRQ